MFDEADLTQDRFLDGKVNIWQPKAGYRAAFDPVLLAAATPAEAGQSVLELGCGAGVASLCLGWRVAGLTQVGLELQPAYAALARKNAAQNAQNLEVLEGDLRHPPLALKSREFDHIIANPPYFSKGSGTKASDAGRETAQREDTPLADWVATGYRRLRPGGWFTVIQSVERLPELLALLSAGGGSLVVLPVAPRAGRAAGRVIVRARKGGRAPFRLLAPVIMHGAARHLRDAIDLSDIARAVLRDGADLPMEG